MCSIRYFTTKASGQGTGLGLSTIHRIVVEHGGEILVETALGRGTSMRIHLPRAAPEAAVARPQPASRDAIVTAGTETVLVVEDEAGVRETMCRMLRGAGYQVIEAADAEQAEAICRSGCGRIDLLVSDVVLPRVKGPELATRLRGLQPGLKVVFVSGYSAETITRSGAALPKFLAKPFTNEGLLQEVRTALR